MFQKTVNVGTPQVDSDSKQQLKVNSIPGRYLLLQVLVLLQFCVHFTIDIMNEIVCMYHCPSTSYIIIIYFENIHFLHAKLPHTCPFLTAHSCIRPCRSMSRFTHSPHPRSSASTPHPHNLNVSASQHPVIHMCRSFSALIMSIQCQCHSVSVQALIVKSFETEVFVIIIIIIISLTSIFFQD